MSHLLSRKIVSTLYHLISLQNGPKYEAAFSTKKSLNSSPGLFFIAAAMDFMVITVKFLWLSFLYLSALNKKHTKTV